jgi:hypothetical protein
MYVQPEKFCDYCKLFVCKGYTIMLLYKNIIGYLSTILSGYYSNNVCNKV